jgi:general secretion pathway protein D
MLVVTDYASNLERIRKVIATVDQPAASELATVRLRFAAAVDVAQAVQRLVPEASQAPGPGAAPRVAVSVDARTNSLLVRADNPTLAKRIRELATGMDVPSASGGNIHVVYLKNAEAVRLAESLRAMISGQPVAQRTSAALGPATPGALDAVQAGHDARRVARRRGSSRRLTGLDPGAPETNSLVIARTGVRGVIEKLDARRAGVRRSADRRDRGEQDGEFGISGIAPSRTPADAGFGVQNFNVAPARTSGRSRRTRCRLARASASA